jgi:tRNA dimethylallyltransferase
MNTVFVVVGPTASGKTDYAIELAKKTDGEIVSADSRQLYVGMNVGTAKPPEAFSGEVHEIVEPDMVEGVPHYLFNTASPDTPWNLPHWQGAAQQVLANIIKHGKQPILVGGTMLYVDSIVKNFDIPEVAPDQDLRDSLEKEDVALLYDRLIQADPAAKAFIEPHHKQRIIRALEVIEKTGKPFSQSRVQHPSPYIFDITGLFPGWDELKARIQTRIEHMFQGELLQETTALRERYGRELGLLQTMNYKQAGMLLDKKVTQDEAIADAVRANLQYAKRQMAWWKNRKEISWE